MPKIVLPAKLGCIEMVAADLQWSTAWYQVRDRKGKIVDVCYQEGHEDSSNRGWPAASRCSGPNGLETETLQQMLKLLGAAPPAGYPGFTISEPDPPDPDVPKECAPEEPIPPIEAGTSAVGDSLNPEQEPKQEANVPNADYNDFDDVEEQHDEEEQDDSRPQPITAEDIARIDQMSPDELNCLIEEVDAHEEWEELRRDAKQRIAYWRGGLKKAHQSPRCAHVATNGKSCGSPALKGDGFCYFHSQSRGARASGIPAESLELPSLEDRLGVQLAIMRVCGMMANKTLDEKTGRAVLVGLRLAERNLAHGDALYGGSDDPK